MVITHCSVPTVVRKTLSQYALLSRVDREPMCPDGGRSKHGDSPSEERTFMRLKIIAGNLVEVIEPLKAHDKKQRLEQTNLIEKKNS